MSLIISSLTSHNFISLPSHNYISLPSHNSIHVDCITILTTYSTVLQSHHLFHSHLHSYPQPLNPIAVFLPILHTDLSPLSDDYTRITTVMSSSLMYADNYSSMTPI